MKTAITIDHIVVDDQGVARIKRSPRMKVIHLVMDRQTNGWSPEDMQAQYPDIPLAAIYAAFSYYYDHKDELDGQIADSTQHAEDLRKANKNTPLAKKLRAIKEARSGA